MRVSDRATYDLNSHPALSTHNTAQASGPWAESALGYLIGLIESDLDLEIFSRSPEIWRCTRFTRGARVSSALRALTVAVMFIMLIYDKIRKKNIYWNEKI